MDNSSKKKKVGRPRNQDAVMEKVICARFTAAEHKEIKKAAGKQPIAAFARQTLLDAAGRKG